MLLGFFYYYLNHTQRRLLYGKPIYLFSFTFDMKVREKKVLLHEIDYNDRLDRVQHNNISNIKERQINGQFAFKHSDNICDWHSDIFLVYRRKIFQYGGFYSLLETNIIY